MLITMMNTGIYWYVINIYLFILWYTCLYLVYTIIFLVYLYLAIDLVYAAQYLVYVPKYQVYDWSFSMPCHMEGPFPMPCHMADSRQYDPFVHCHISVTYIYSFSPFPPTHCVIQYLITYDMYFRYAGFLWHVSNTEIHLVYAVIYSS